MNEDDSYRDLIRLWILRMLGKSEYINFFIQSDGFRDDDIARALGLHRWVDCEKKAFAPRAIRLEMQSLVEGLEAHAESLRPPASYLSNCDRLSGLLGLCCTERAVLLFEIIRQDKSVLTDVLNITGPHKHRSYAAMLARAFNRPIEEVVRAMNLRRSALLESSILRWNHMSMRGGSFELEFAQSEIPARLLNGSCDVNTLVRSVVSPAPPPTLAYRDYPHLKDSLGMLRRHIRNVLRQRRAGVNIYLHGPPGTGKSELVRTIAREMRCTLYEVAFEDGDGDSVLAGERLCSLRAAQSLLRKKRSMLVFDEAEDIFGNASIFERSYASRRKAWMNRMFESNAVPTFWVSNAIRGLDRAFLRRFDFIVELPVPPKRQRERTYRRICGDWASPVMIRKIATCDTLTPAVVSRAKGVAEGICDQGDLAGFERTFGHLIRQTLKAQGHDTAALDRMDSVVPAVFDTGYLNCDHPMEHLPAALKTHPSCRICLYGPPGTGKTTIGHWLSDQLGRPLLLKKASDLLSPYLGESEQNIAGAFAEAKTGKSILMIDEVDSFLQDRGGAQRSWEVSQVNEFLTQMESFDGIFIASTNLMDGIDPAALRRFDFKLRFGYLDFAQREGLLRAHAKELKLGNVCASALTRLRNLENATPGDFANVARQHRFQIFSSPAEFVEAVAAECALKSGHHRHMGFG